MHCTVLMPVFNTKPYIAEAIHSVFAQIYADWDLVVVDDGSTDGSHEIVESLMPGLNVTLIRHPKNLGLSSALTTAMKYAKGPVLTFMGDDRLTPQSLAIGTAPFADPSVGFVWTNFKFMNTGKNGWSSPTPDGCSLWDALCLRGWWRACCQQFWSKPWYLKSRGLDLDIPYAVDYQLAVLLGETMCKTMFLNHVTYLARYPRVGSMSASHRQEQSACDKEVRRRSRLRMGR